jgi:hydrogenase maturation protein HypF
MPQPFERWRLTVSGLVQGVGFRPFLFNLARGLELTGWVRNNFAGVEIEIQGAHTALARFSAALRERPPAAAQIDGVERETIPPLPGEDDFTIIPSQSGRLPGSPLPDQGICPDCAAEFFDPANRRYHHPFNSCTLCGPRFTIMEALPFDRSRTAMEPFPLCPDCQREYTNPADRRFHAQTIACPQCGPKLWFRDAQGRPGADDPAGAARRILKAGGILAVKGIGGYHLACDARNAAAVDRLRRLKGRDNRAFAVMFRDPEAIAAVCRVTPEEAALLAGPVRPIVLLLQREGGALAPGVNPGLRELGAFLPYTGIQLLLFEDELTALVMTSGNRSGEPLSIGDEEARRDLGPMADGFLGHDRRIRWRCDDSVLRWQAGRTIGIRRSRGLTPAPVRLERKLPPLLACGAQQKNVFALTQDERVYLGPHQGDLDNAASFLAYRETIAAMQRLLHCQPEWAVHDLHPDYNSTRYARESGLPLLGVQHHLAHIAAVIAAERLDGPVLGVAFDGSGYGPDGAVWGGEFFIGSGCAWRRVGQLEYYPLPGGEAAVREPWRMTAAYLNANAPALLEEWLEARELGKSWPLLRQAVRAGINAPPTSSVGRWFDGVAALLGGPARAGYEGEAAVWLENQADPAAEDRFELPFRLAGDGFRIDPGALAAALARERHRLGPAALSMKFHRTVAALIREAARWARREAGIDRVVLSGGVFQNRLLLDLTLAELETEGFRVAVPQWVPINDGGIAFGQAWLGGLMIERGVDDVLGGAR